MKRAATLLKELKEILKFLHDHPLGGSWSDPSPGTNDSWMALHSFKDISQRLLLVNLEFALDHDVHHELWNVAFKGPINLLQARCKDKKNPRRLQAQSDLYWFVDSASGFYLRLLGTICDAHDLDFSFRRSGQFYGLSGRLMTENILVTPQSNSVSSFLQQALVHLGDLARYRNQMKLAYSYYCHAQRVCPIAGQPYSQLALLAAGQGDTLKAAFLYARGTATKSPFAPASLNLTSVLQKCLQSTESEDFPPSVTSSRVPGLFLRCLSLLVVPNETGSQSITAVSLSRLLGSQLPSIIASKGLSQDTLLQMVALMIHFAETVSSQQPEVSSKKKVPSCREIILDLLFDLMSALLLPLYLIKEGSGIKMEAHPGLPSAKIILDWLRFCCPSVLNASALRDRPQIWPALCHLLNQFQPDDAYSQVVKKYSRSPLPEDWKLEGFLHLAPAHRGISFSRSSLVPSHAEGDALRVHRLGDTLSWLATKGEFVSVNLEGKKKMFEPQVQGNGKNNRLSQNPLPSLSSLLETNAEVTIKPGILKMSSLLSSAVQKPGSAVVGSSPTSILPQERKSRNKPNRRNIAMSSILKAPPPTGTANLLSAPPPFSPVSAPVKIDVSAILSAPSQPSPPLPRSRTGEDILSAILRQQHEAENPLLASILKQPQTAAPFNDDSAAVTGKSVSFRTPPRSAASPDTGWPEIGNREQPDYQYAESQHFLRGFLESNSYQLPPLHHLSGGAASAEPFPFAHVDGDSIWDQPIATRRPEYGGLGKRNPIGETGSPVAPWPPPLFTQPPPPLPDSQHGRPSASVASNLFTPPSIPSLGPPRGTPSTAPSSSYSLFGSGMWSSGHSGLLNPPAVSLGFGSQRPMSSSNGLSLWSLSTAPSSGGRLFDIRPPSQPP